MKTQGRPKSKNVKDKRSYFGSDSLSGMSTSSKNQAFYIDSIRGAASNRVEGTKFKKPRKRGKGGR